MSEVQATFSVDGKSFAKKKDATAYAAVHDALTAAGYEEDFIAKAMDAYSRGFFSVQKKVHGPRKSKD